MPHATHMRRRLPGLAALLLLVPLAAAQAANPAAGSADGEALFRQQCGTCHSAKKGDGPRAGPPLFGVNGRKAGAIPGFDYSDALRDAGFTWDPAHLEHWLTDSNGFVPGSYMNYRQEDEAVRKGIIQFLSGTPAN